MSLKEKIQKDFIEAFKAREEIKSSVLKMLQAAIKNAEIEKKGELDDGQIIQAISKESKKRKDAMAAFEKGGRNEMAEKEKKEFDILSAYLPEQMPEDDVRRLAEKAVKESGASGMREFGKVMSILMPQIKGRADGLLVGGIVKQLLE